MAQLPQDNDSGKRADQRRTWRINTTYGPAPGSPLPAMTSSLNGVHGNDINPRRSSFCIPKTFRSCPRYVPMQADSLGGADRPVAGADWPVRFLRATMSRSCWSSRGFNFHVLRFGQFNIFTTAIATKTHPSCFRASRTRGILPHRS
jgi:hypothetical protein